MQRGDISKIRNTAKRCRFEADNYLCAYLRCDDGTNTGIMLTEREFKIAVKRFWKNKEDHPKCVADDKVEVSQPQPCPKSKTGFWRRVFKFGK